jgi:uncharacterized protein YjbJ (UPF0337 family)
MSTDEVQHKAEELKGEAKEKLGDWTDNESLEVEGLADQAKAKVGQAADEVEDAARDVRDTDNS